MAYADTHTRSSILHAISVPFSFVGNLLMQIGMASSIAKKVDHLNAMSDADLAAAGTTRHNEIQKLFRAHTMI